MTAAPRIYGKQTRPHLRGRGTIAAVYDIETRPLETILVVEDEPAVLDVARRTLMRAGYAVRVAGSAAEALADHHAQDVDLLLTDVVMPGLNGRELAEALRARRPSLRVLFMSGYPDDAALRRGIESAVQAFIQKPFSGRDLVARVREVLDAPAAETGETAPAAETGEACCRR